MQQYFILIIASSLLFAATSAFGQQSCANVLYLKNGSIIKGTIVEAVPGGTVKIQTADGSLFVYSMDEVLKIASEVTVTGHPAPQKNGNVFELKRKGFIGSFEMGGVTFGEDAGGFVSGQLILGYQFNPTISLSLGSGIELGNGLNMIPFFS